MSGQPTLFEEVTGLQVDPGHQARHTYRQAEGRRRRDEGAARVTRNEADPSPVDDAIAALASSGERFTADDLDPEVREAVHHPNVVSAAFLRAVRSGLIVEVGWTRSDRPKAHGRRLVEYRGAPS